MLRLLEPVGLLFDKVESFAVIAALVESHGGEQFSIDLQEETFHNSRTCKGTDHSDPHRAHVLSGMYSEPITLCYNLFAA
jgi:hypothetical protein